MNLWDKAVEVRLAGLSLSLRGSIRYARDEGPRIAFSGSRSMLADPDQGTIRVWNLPEDLTRAIAQDAKDLQLSLSETQKRYQLSDEVRSRLIVSALEGHAIEVYAGYGDNPQLIFRGDPIEVRRVRDGLDWVTEIDVGDGFVALQQQYLASQYGVGVTPAGLLAFAFALVDAQGDRAQMEAAVTAVAPNAFVAQRANGFTAVGRPIDTIRDVATYIGLQWWVRNGKVEFVARDEVLPDFAVLLTERGNLLELGEPDEQDYVQFTALLSPEIHPGRGVVFQRATGEEFKARVMSTEIVLDSHEDAWAISGMANGTPFQFGQIVEPF